ncbi:MAG: hypothetical protein ACK56F_01350, partial [bacterium]
GCRDDRLRSDRDGTRQRRLQRGHVDGERVGCERHGVSAWDAGESGGRGYPAQCQQRGPLRRVHLADHRHVCRGSGW